MTDPTWSFNEESARYREMDPVFYVPDSDRLLRQAGKPGHYNYVPGAPGDLENVVTSARSVYGSAFREYSRMLESGIAREIARMVLPVATYSSVYATCNARALMHFLGLRTNRPDAAYPSSPQREIELVAEGMEIEFARLIRTPTPRSRSSAGSARNCGARSSTAGTGPPPVPAASPSTGGPHADHHLRRVLVG